MRYPNFVGATYSGQSPTPATDRAINLMPERAASGSGAESDIWYLGTPGLVAFAAIPGAAKIDGLYLDPVSGRCFAAASSQLYEVTAAGSVLGPYGGIGSAPYSFASQNSGQVAIANASGNGYVFLTGSNKLIGIPAGSFLGATAFQTIDDYVIGLVPDSREFQISSLLDATSWSGLDFGASSGGPDNVVAFAAIHRELWLFTGTRAEIYVDNGQSSFPFTRLNGAYLETGIAAARSLVRLDNTLFWLGQDERGAGMVWRANGYTPERVSTHAVEYWISEYIKNGGISDAVAYAYQDAGHSFYVLHFPSATVSLSATGGSTPATVLGATWVYDVATGLWHERGFWNQQLGEYQAHLGRVHAYAFGKHLVGDYQSGNLYTMSLDAYDDAGAFIRRIRRAPHLNSEGLRLFHHELALNIQTGAGNANDPNPACWLSKSDDGGLTWSSQSTQSLGAAGLYSTRVRWQMLGASRRRAYEWGTTARVPVCLVDAYIRTTAGEG